MSTNSQRTRTGRSRRSAAPYWLAPPHLRGYTWEPRHAYGILNHAEYPMDTSRLEGVNNKIKVIKRRSTGYHDTKYFALKVKQAFPGEGYESTNLFG
jgi:transposase